MSGSVYGRTSLITRSTADVTVPDSKRSPTPVKLSLTMQPLSRPRRTTNCRADAMHDQSPASMLKFTRDSLPSSLRMKMAGSSLSRPEAQPGLNSIVPGGYGLQGRAAAVAVLEIVRVSVCRRGEFLLHGFPSFGRTHVWADT